MLSFSAASKAMGKRGGNHGGMAQTGETMLNEEQDRVTYSGPFDRRNYVRQLRDMKIAASVETLDGERLSGYARLCGLILARSHAKSGMVVPEIKGYLGKSDIFATALVSYVKSYADIAERDYGLFRRACRSGRLQARTDENFAYDLSMATK